MNKCDDDYLKWFLNQITQFNLIGESVLRTLVLKITAIEKARSHPVDGGCMLSKYF